MFIIKLVIQCQQSAYPSYPIPFSSAECRQALYHVLLCCLLSNSPYVPSPVNHAVKLFSGGLQDADLKVRVWEKTGGGGTRRMVWNWERIGVGTGREGLETERDWGGDWERMDGNWERMGWELGEKGLELGEKGMGTGREWIGTGR